MLARAILTLARRPVVKCLLIVSACGWISLAWLVSGHGAHATNHFAATWLAMVLAMTPPLLIREFANLWRSSLRRTRYLTITSFAIAYVAIWVVAGELLSTLLELIEIKTSYVVVTAALAVLWHGSPSRQRRLNACHRMPALRVFGAAAQWDSMRYGARTGANCVAACFLVMLLPLMVTKLHFAVMAVAAVMMTVERYLPPRRPRWRLTIAARRSLDWPDMDMAIVRSKLPHAPQT